MYNILEHRKAVEDNIKKAFGNTLEDIEKAKWQIGEVRVDSRGIAHECFEYVNGKPHLRRVKKNKGVSTTSTDNGNKKDTSNSEVEIDNDEYKKQYDIVLKQLMSGSDEDKHAVNFGISIVRSNISNTKKELKELKETRPGAKKAIQKLESDLVKFHSQEKAFNDALKTASGTKKEEDKPEQKNEDLFKVGELKNGFKFKKDTEYVLRYNKYEKQYEVFENKTQRGAGKVPMWVCKSDNGDEKFGEKILKVVQKNYAKEGSTISFGNKIYPLSLNDKKEDNVPEGWDKIKSINGDEFIKKEKNSVCIIIPQKDGLYKLNLKYSGYMDSVGDDVKNLTKQEAVKIGNKFLKDPRGYFGLDKDFINNEVSNFMKLVQKFSGKYTDESKVTVTKTSKGNWDVSYDGHRLGIINANQLSEKTAKSKGWLKEENQEYQRTYDIPHIMWAMGESSKMSAAVESLAASEIGNSKLDFGKRMSKKKIKEIVEKLPAEKLDKLYNKYIEGK